MIEVYRSAPFHKFGIFAITETGYLASWDIPTGEEPPTPRGPFPFPHNFVAIFGPDGSFLRRWEPPPANPELIVLSVYAGKSEFYIAVAPSSSWYEGEWQWFKMNPATGVSEPYEAMPARTIAMCDPPLWMVPGDDFIRLWNGDKVGNKDDARHLWGGNVSWVQYDQTCRAALKLSKDLLLFEIDRQGGIRKRWTMTEESQRLLSGSTGTAVPFVYPIPDGFVAEASRQVIFFNPEDLTRFVEMRTEGTQLRVIAGPAGIAFPIGNNRWKVCRSETDCKTVTAPNTIPYAASGFRIQMNGFYCVTRIGPEEGDSSPMAPHRESVQCYDPFSERAPLYQIKWRRSEVLRPSFFVPLTPRTILAGMPPTLIEGGNRRYERPLRDLKYDRAKSPSIAGAYGKYLYFLKPCWVNKTSPALGAIGTEGIKWYAHLTSKEAERYEPLGVLRDGRPVLFRAQIKPSSRSVTGFQTTSFSVLILSRERGWFGIGIDRLVVVNLPMEGFNPRNQQWVRYRDSGWLIRKPLGPFLDEKDRLWLVSVESGAWKEGNTIHHGTVSEIRAYQLPTGKEVIRYALRQARSSDSTPSSPEGWEGRALTVLCPAEWCLRAIPGGDRFLYQQAWLLSVVDAATDKSVTFGCPDFCADVVEWHPQSAREWLAEKPGALYRVVLKADPLQ
jgi:hypothetical protein